VDFSTGRRLIKPRTVFADARIGFAMLPSAAIVSRRRALDAAGAIVTCFSLRSAAQEAADLAGWFEVV
jgi:hypothetical protein